MKTFLALTFLTFSFASFAHAKQLLNSSVPVEMIQLDKIITDDATGCIPHTVCHHHYHCPRPTSASEVERECIVIDSDCATVTCN